MMIWKCSVCLEWISGTNEENQVVIIYAVLNGYLDKVDAEKVHLYESRLYEYMETKGRDVLEAIRDTGELKKETEMRLKELLSAFTAEFSA